MATPLRISLVWDQSQGAAGLKGLTDQLMDGLSHVEARIEELFSRGRISDTIQRLGASGNSAFAGMARQLNDLGNAASRFYYAMKDIEMVSRGIGRTLSAPYRAVLSDTEDDRRFRVAVSGQVGGMARASAVDEELMRIARDAPMTIRELREIGVSMSRLVTESAQLGAGSAGEVAKRIAGYSDTVARLSALNPYSSNPEETTRALQLLMEGNARGARRLGVDPSELARIAGVRQQDFTGNPALLMDSLRTYLDRVAPQGVAGSRGDLASVAEEKLRDTLKVAFSRIGDAGLYDHIVQSFRSVTSRAFDYLNSNSFSPRAKSISESMGKTFDAVGESIATLAERLTGARNLEELPDKIGESFQRLSGRIAEFAKNLPGLASDIGTGVRNVAKSLETISNTLGRFNNVASRPGETTGSFILDYADDKRLRLDPEERKRRQLVAIQNAMVGMGIGGTSISDYTSSSPISLFGLNLGESITHGYQLSTRAIRDPKRAMLAEQIIRLAESMDPNAVQDPESMYRSDNLLAAARGSIPDFDTRLNAVLGRSVAPGAYHLPAALQAMTGQANREGYLEPNYAAQFRGAFDSAAGLSTWMGTNDPLARMFMQSGLKLKDLTGGGSGVDAFDRVKAFRDEAVGYLDKLRDALKAEAEKDPQHAKDLGAMIAGVEKDIDAHLSGFSAQSDELAKDLVDGLGRFGVQLSQSVTRSGATYTADILNLWIQGKTAVQQQVASLLNQHGYSAPGGLDSLPLEQRAAFIDEATKANLQRIALYGGSPNLARMSPQQVAAMGYLPHPMSANAQAQYLQETALPLAQKNFSDAQARFNSLGPGADASKVEEYRRAMDQAGESVAKLSQELRQVQVAGNAALQNLIQFGHSATSAIEGGLGNALYDVITRTKNTSQAFRQMGAEILHEFTQMISRTVVDSGKNILLFFIEKLIGGFVGGMAGGPGGAAAGGVVTGGAEAGAYYDGGVIGGGIHFFSRGGVAHRPMLGIVGDRADVPEAVVPMLGPGRTIPLGIDHMGNIHAALPGGRRIAASFPSVGSYADGGVMGGAVASGGYGGGMPLTLNSHVIVVDDRTQAEAHAAGIRAIDRDAVVHIVTSDLVRGGKISQQIRKGAGR